MNGQNSLPPDKGKSNENLHQNDESILNGFEIKPEPTVKQELEDTNDMVTVLALECAASGSIVKLIDDEQTGDAYDFNHVCELDEAKSELKKEIDKEAERCSAECSGKGAIEPRSSNDSMDYRSNKQQKQSKRGPHKNASKTAAIAKNKPKTSIRSNKKKSTASKGLSKQHKCSSCDYTTSYKSHLDQHIRTHTGEKPFPCTHCAKRFTQKSNLQKHMRMHVSEFLFSCSNCLKGFTQSDEKVEHENSCKIRRYECHLCKEYSAFRKSHLKYHMRVQHTGEKPFGCDQCSKKFPQQIDLKRHQKTHIKSRPLKPKCSVCYQNFSHRIEKDEHEAKCKRRGYECFVCKEFTSNLLNNLKDHMRIHSGLRPFQCDLCQKSYTVKSNLGRHSKKMHK